MRIVYFIGLLIVLSVIIVPIWAQDMDATPSPTPTEIPIAMVEPEQVILQAEAGTFLVGDFYLVDPLSPTVVLLHQIYTNRSSWEPVMGPLLGAHYNVLAVDLRGYGDSSKSINWHKAVTDVQLWIDWIRTDSGVLNQMVSTMGSSMGSTLAIVGCANDPLCQTAIAISPGWDYYGIVLGEALSVGMANRPTMIIYTERDRWPALGMPDIEAAATGPLTINMFAGNAHGMDVIKQYEDETIPMVLDWFVLYSKP